jgi:hypothetical protein
MKLELVQFANIIPGDLLILGCSDPDMEYVLSCRKRANEDRWTLKTNTKVLIVDGWRMAIVGRNKEI